MGPRKQAEIFTQPETSVQLATAKEPEVRPDGNGQQYGLPSPLAEVTPEQEMLRLAIENRQIETVERLIAMMREERAYQAQVKFDEALSLAQAEMTVVIKDMTNPQTKSDYASYEALDEMVRPIYTKHGFSISFDEEDSPKADHVRVVGILARAGHRQRYHKDICADGKGAKGGDVMTRTHAEGAADSYGMRYLVKKMFNIAIGEEDDDGNLMPEDKEKDFLCSIGAAGSLPELERAYKDAMKGAYALKDYQACKVFDEAMAKRAKELRA